MEDTGGGVIYLPEQGTSEGFCCWLLQKLGDEGGSMVNGSMG